MKEFTYSFKEGVTKGLTPTMTTDRNAPWLLTSLGIHPEDNSLVTCEMLDLLDRTGLPDCEFPYPQLFSTSVGRIACTEYRIYRFEGGSWVSKVADLQEALPWSLADFGGYLVLTNGIHSIVRDPASGEFTDQKSIDFPCGTYICSTGSQLVVASPNLSAEWYYEHTRFAINLETIHNIIHVYLPGQFNW